ncbi:MAG: HlyD family type I secretion periplasmic adaptor subunit [Rubrivivax sp.]
MTTELGAVPPMSPMSPLGPLGAAADAAGPLSGHLAEARRLARWGGLVLALGVLPAFAWLALAPLSSAVVAPAFVKVDLDRRTVQHAEGGTVREVLVRDGQRVKQGQPLLVLGDVAVDADVNRIDYRVLADGASVARLEAEQIGAAALVFPATLEQASVADPRLAEQMGKERALFTARREALVGQVALLRSQQAKLGQELQALAAQIVQAGASLAHQVEELESHRRLQKEGFVSATRVSQLEGQVADYRVKLEERRGEQARAEQRRVDSDLRIKAFESEYRQQASDQLKVAAARLIELQQEQRKTTDASKRQVITAPADGDVLNLRFTAPGGVVAPREPIADIVPADPRLVVETHVRPEDVNRVHFGQAAKIRFTAFVYRTTRLVEGKVVYLSPDRLVDRNSGAPYYVAQIEADAASLAKEHDIKLLAGMPAEVYIEGGERTPLQYLADPVLQVMRRAGRER